MRTARDPSVMDVFTRRIIGFGVERPEMLLKPGAPDTGVTNVRKTWLPHWRHWLAVANRCVVPATAFCEYSQTPDPMTKKKPKIWFAIDESQPLFFFAGIWTNWTGVRGSMKTPRAVGMPHVSFASSRTPFPILRTTGAGRAR
jgi:putative SOS response-associated peptidase YedK